MRRGLGLPAALAGAVAAGVVATVAIRGGSAPAVAPPVRVGTATVVRTDLATTVLAGGTLGYAAARPLVNRVAGTYTSLPGPGATISRDGVLYRVDNQPVTLMTGRTPAWRPFAPGMTAGPDVAELQANLIALGYASGLYSAPSGQYDEATSLAVERWQAAAAYPVTGQVALGAIIFEPGPVRVGALQVAPGQEALPGQSPYQVTAIRRTVVVPMSPALPQAQAGERVSIVLPSDGRTPGRVTAVGPPPSAVATGPGRAAGPGAALPAGTTSVLTVTPDIPGATGTGVDVPVQVSLTIEVVRHALAVPVSALLALAGGGYGVEIVTGPGQSRLIGVTAGIFAGGLVQVTGAGLAPGVKVEVAQ